jgi:enoyl-CoA hydratase/carnithine racemase
VSATIATPTKERSMDKVLFTVTDGVAHVTLNRPEVLNAVDDETHHRPHDIWDEVERRTDIRVVVLTGSGDRAFCAGSDMKSQNERTGIDYWAAGHPDGYGGLTVRRSLTVPVIGRINGVAMGGGLELALGCDILVVAEHAVLGLPEAKVGRVPLDGGVIALTRQLPHRLAMQMLLTGEPVTAQRALEIGLVNVVVSADELDDATDAMVRSVLRCAPLSLAAIKAMVNRGDGLPTRDAVSLRVPEVFRALTSKDADEGVQAFIEKREPVWLGE